MDHIIPGSIPNAEQDFIRYKQPPAEIEVGERILDAQSLPTSFATDIVDGGRASKPSMIERIKSLKNTWRDGNIKTYMTLESMRDEFWEDYNTAETFKEKADLVSTTGIAISGQVYERFRFPETLAAWVATNSYKEAVERGHLTATATLIGSALVGVVVYAQQKLIGRNMLRTVKHFPNTYDTAKDLWPKAIDVVDDTLPGIDKPVQQGIAMVSVGTTPFVMTARANNPDIETNELIDIERKVTRRGSIASAGAGVVVLGSLSLAPHIPDEINLNVHGSLLNPLVSTHLRIPIPDTFAEQMVDKSDLIIDTLSSPVKMIGLLTLATMLGKIKSGFSEKDSQEQ